MREILFRGKREDSGEWAEGYYVHLHDDKSHGSHRIYTGYAESDCGEFYPDWYEVAPETVGQDTGLTDKNGKKIFEGDVVAYTEQKFDGSDEICLGKVKFVDGMWAVGTRALCDWLFNSANGNIQLDEIEVIGNIHDDPELLGGADNGEAAD